MWKFMWLLAAWLMVICCLYQCNTEARSATAAAATKTTAQQLPHVNSLTINNHSNKDNVEQQHYNNNNNAVNAATSSSTTPAIWKDLSFVYRIYQQCSNENLSACLKVKLLAGLEKALRRSKTLQIIEGVQFVKSDADATAADADGGGEHEAATISERDIEATLPRSLQAKDHILNNMIFKKVANFLRDYTLQVKFPDVRNVEQFSMNSVESRKKKDKKGNGAYIMIPLLLGGTFVPIAYGALAMLAGKALIVSKLALVLASIIGIKKLLSGGSKDSSHEVVVQSGGHSGWGRDMDLAYNGWKAAQAKEMMMKNAA